MQAPVLVSDGDAARLELVCQFCGKHFVVPLKKGRALNYCSQNCRDGFKYLQAFSRCVYSAKFSASAARVVSGDIFALANECRARVVLIGTDKKAGVQ